MAEAEKRKRQLNPPPRSLALQKRDLNRLRSKHHKLARLHRNLAPRSRQPQHNAHPKVRLQRKKKRSCLNQPKA